MRPPKAATNDVSAPLDSRPDAVIFHTPQQPRRRHYHHDHHHRSATMRPVSSKLSAGSLANNGTVSGTTTTTTTTTVGSGAAGCNSSGSAMKLSVSMISLPPPNSSGLSVGGEAASVATMRPYNSLKVSFLNDLLKTILG